MLLSYYIGTKVIAVLNCEFWIIITRFKDIFISQNRSHYNQHVFANKKCLFIPVAQNSYFRIWQLLERIFCLLLVVEAFSLQNIVQMLEEVVVSWREVRWIWQMKWNFIAQCIQLLKCWLCDMCLGIVIEKNWVLSVDQCWLQELQFSVHFIDLLNILPRYNGFARTQKSVVDQTSSRPPNSNHDFFFFWCKFSFGKCFRASSSSNHWAGHCWLSYKIQFLLHVTIWLRQFSIVNILLLLHRVREDDSSK